MMEARQLHAPLPAGRRRPGRDDRTILVAGYDGTPDAAAAVRWAASRVAQRGRLVIVCAHHPAVPSPVRADAAARSRAQLEALWLEDDALVDVDVQLVVVDQPPAEALVEAAARSGADAIVIGRHRPSPFKGDVVRQLLILADRPVTVVPA